MSNAVLMAVDPRKHKDVGVLLNVMEAGYNITSSVAYRHQIVYTLVGERPLPPELKYLAEVKET